jgi:hypothetical protein
MPGQTGVKATLHELPVFLSSAQPHGRAYTVVEERFRYDVGIMM